MQYFRHRVNLCGRHVQDYFEPLVQQDVEFSGSHLNSSGRFIQSEEREKERIM